MVIINYSYKLLQYSVWCCLLFAGDQKVLFSLLSNLLISMLCPREKELAKKYYDKLFKEYCIADLSRYKENKVG